MFSSIAKHLACRLSRAGRHLIEKSINVGNLVMIYQSKHLSNLRYLLKYAKYHSCICKIPFLHKNTHFSNTTANRLTIDWYRPNGSCLLISFIAVSFKYHTDNESKLQEAEELFFLFALTLSIQRWPFIMVKSKVSINN
mgnify:CR=1 FL=1